MLPPSGKNLALFQQEDTVCRGYAQQQIGYDAPRQTANEAPTVGAAARGGPSAGSAVGAVNASASAAELQWRYDVAYAQCMAASGNSLQTFPLAALYAPYGYPYGYPGYYDPW